MENFNRPDDEDSLFFHQQKNPVRQYRRVRKEPEELPQALRYFKYANLNPRIAAFLGKQDPKSLLKRGKGQGGKSDGKEGDQAAASTGLMGAEFGNDLSREARSLLPDIGPVFGKMSGFDDGFGQSRLSFNNEIEDPQRYQFEETTFAAPNILRELADTLSRFNVSFKEYAERTTLYDPDSGEPLSNDAISPSVLLPKGIKDLLCQNWDDVTAEAIYTPRVWQSAVQASNKQVTAMPSAKHEPPPPIPNPPKATEGSGEKKTLPSLAGGLKSIVDLLEESRIRSHAKRDGDTTETKTLYDYKRKGKTASKDATQTSTGLPVRLVRLMESNTKNGEEEQQEAVIEELFGADFVAEKNYILSTQFRNTNQATGNASKAIGNANKATVSGKSDGIKSKTAIQKQPSKLSTAQDRPKISSLASRTQISKQQSKSNFRSSSKPTGQHTGKLLGIPEERGAALNKIKDWSQRSNVSVMGMHDGAEKLPRHGGNPTLSFNLSSKKAIEEGWIVNAQPEPDMEQNNLLEWATGRLQTAIKQKEEEEDQAKKMGCDKPVMLRYYGDSRRDTLLKLYRKGNESDGKAGAIAAGLIPGKKPGGVPKIPQLSKLDSGKKEKFMVQLQDGSITVYYPKNGEVALMASAVPDNPGQLYVHCYANNQDRTCLATFTPYGKSCCYHKNGVPGLILTDQGGLIKSEDGSVRRKWEWPKNGAKLKENVVFQLNKEMYVRVLSKNNVSLHYSSNRESVKVPVGALQGVDAPPATTAEYLGVLQSGYNLTSKAAADFQHSHRGKDDKAKTAKTRRSFNYRKLSKKPYELEELKHSLDPPERFEFESQADRELIRLQGKTRHLVEDWMEHYRLAVGISSPALKKLFDKPLVKSPHRNIQSARERKVVSAEDEEFDEKGTKFQSFRSPSAPPRHMMPGPHSVTIKDNRATMVTSTPLSKKTGESPHVRIDDTPTDAAKPKSGKDQTTSQPNTSSSSRQRPATHGSRSVQRRSILRTTSSANASTTSQLQSREKAWTPASECCPVATRCKMANTDKKTPDKNFSCKCSKHRIPNINDLEFDYFLRMVAPVAQLIVICVVNSLYPDASPYDEMFDRMYIDKNKNRTNPCRQSRHDQYRVLRYDLAIAKMGTNRSTPLLLGRHNVVPGMTLMYCGGRLLFADHIFNGYGNARNDFRKQVFKSRQEYMMGKFLPDDFRFTPGRGKSGARAAWGGEMGGAGVDGKGSPGMFFSNPIAMMALANKSKSAGIRVTSPRLLDATHSASDVTSNSSIALKMPASKSFDTSRDFVQYSLSTRMYVLPHVRQSSHTAVNKSPRVGATARQTSLNSTFPPTSATPHSAVASDGSLRVSQMNSFIRMQTVK